MTGHSVGERDIRKTRDGIGGHSMGGVPLYLNIIRHCRAKATSHVVRVRETVSALTAAELQYVLTVNIY